MGENNPKPAGLLTTKISTTGDEDFLRQQLLHDCIVIVDDCSLIVIRVAFIPFFIRFRQQVGFQVAPYEECCICSRIEWY